MSKELTEQWRNGWLENGLYYLELKDGRIEIDYLDGQFFKVFFSSNIKEVLAPVPAYDQFVEPIKKVYELTQQLAEANKILFNVWDCREDREYYAELAKSYFEKYGVEK